MEDDVRDVVYQARRRRIIALRADRAGLALDGAKAAMTGPVTKEERKALALSGDRLYEMQLLGQLTDEQVGAGHDFAARYLRWAMAEGLPRRTAKIVSLTGLAAGSGAGLEVDPERVMGLRERHERDVAVVKREAFAGAIQHLFAAAVEDRPASVYLLRSALDALIKFHTGKGRADEEK